MFFAKDNTWNQFELYFTFLDEIVFNDNETYKAFFHNIVDEAKRLSSGTLNYSELTREHFDIVTLLANNHADYFRDIDADNITLQDYQNIHSFLEADLEQHAH